WPLEASLFLGAAIAITAFPMLARIIHERGIAGTSLGTLALTAGAADDAAAWCILAVVLASFGGTWGGAWLAIGGGAAFALLMLLLGRRPPAAGRAGHANPAGRAAGGRHPGDRAGAVLPERLGHGRDRHPRRLRRLRAGRVPAARARLRRKSACAIATVRGGVPAADVLHLLR